MVLKPGKDGAVLMLFLGELYMRQALLSVALVAFACVVSIAVLVWFGQDSVNGSYAGSQTLHIPYLVAY